MIVARWPIFQMVICFTWRIDTILSVYPFIGGFQCVFCSEMYGCLKTGNWFECMDVLFGPPSILRPNKIPYMDYIYIYDNYYMNICQYVWFEMVVPPISYVTKTHVEKIFLRTNHTCSLSTGITAVGDLHPYRQAEVQLAVGLWRCRGFEKWQFVVDPWNYPETVALI